MLSGSSNLDKIQNDRRSQIDFFLSCIDARMPFSQLTFIMDRFDLSESYFKEAINESHPKFQSEKASKDKTDKKTNGNLPAMQKSVRRTIELCLQVMHEIDSVAEENSHDWTHQVLKQLIPEFNLIQNGNKMAQNSTKVNNGSIDGNVHLETKWEKDSAVLEKCALSNENDLDLHKYFETIELIEMQEKRINNQLYTKIAQINKSLFTNRVCFNF